MNNEIRFNFTEDDNKTFTSLMNIYKNVDLTKKLNFLTRLSQSLIFKNGTLHI